MNLATALKLGRVSNLPTVWTNVLAGTVLAGGASVLVVVLVTIAMSLAYVGGMFLNDAFDRRIDAKERPERPIPSGQATAATVFAAGFAMLGASVLLLVLLPFFGDVGSPFASVASGVVLGGLVVLYDVWHKKNPLSPLLMGLCRVAVYVTAAYAARPDLCGDVIGGALVLLSYLIGLTYTAKQENLGRVKNMWPLAFLFAPSLYAAGALFSFDLSFVIYVAFNAWVVTTIAPLFRGERSNVPRAVVRLIAGIALLDALLIARAGEPLVSSIALAGFGAALFLQRWVRGT
jgi:hypothetical protein